MRLPAPAGILAEGTFTTVRTVTLALANANTGVSGGNTLTLSTGLAYSAAANTFAKTENGTLALAANATGAPTSGTTINAGAIKPISSAALGSERLRSATPLARRCRLIR